MVAPILLEGTNTVPAYFPAGKWYDLYNHSSIDTSDAAQHLPVMVGPLLHDAVLLHSKCQKPVSCLRKDVRQTFVSGIQANLKVTLLRDIKIVPAFQTAPDHDLTVFVSTACMAML